MTCDTVRVCVQARNKFGAAMLMLSGFHVMSGFVRAWAERMPLPDDSLEGCPVETLVSLAKQPEVRAHWFLQIYFHYFLQTRRGPTFSAVMVWWNRA